MKLWNEAESGERSNFDLENLIRIFEFIEVVGPGVEQCQEHLRE